MSMRQWGLSANEGRFTSEPARLSADGVMLWSPRSLTNLWGWWSARAVADLADQTVIEPFPDLSGNGRDLNHADGQYIEKRTDGHGRPYAWADAGLANTDGYFAGAVPGSTVTVFAVAATEQDPPYGDTSIYGWVGGGTGLLVFDTSFECNVGTGTVTVGSCRPGSIPTVYAVKNDYAGTGERALYLNGLKAASDSSAGDGSNGATDFRVFSRGDGSYVFSGRGYEFIVVEEALSDSTIQQISRILSARWATSLGNYTVN